MIIMIIALSILIISFIILMILETKDKFRQYDEFETSLIFIVIITFIINVIFGILIWSEHTAYHRERVRISYEERYYTIMAAIENEEDWILLVTDIADYNTEIKQARAKLQNPWVNWFVSDVYNELPLIPKHYNSDSTTIIKEVTTHEK